MLVSKAHFLLIWTIHYRSNIHYLDSGIPITPTALIKTFQSQRIHFWNIFEFIRSCVKVDTHHPILEKWNHLYFFDRNFLHTKVAVSVLDFKARHIQIFLNSWQESFQMVAVSASNIQLLWSEWRGSNSQLRDPKSRRLPIGLHPDLVELTGIEPVSEIPTWTKHFYAIGNS